MPYCSICGKESPDGAKFCVNCGTDLAVTTFPPPPPPSSPGLPRSPADLGSRIVAGIVDYIIVGIIAAILSVFALGSWMVTGSGMMGGFRSTWFTGMFSLMGLMWILWLAYFTYFEGTSGQTIGKKLTNIKVIKEDGSNCDLGSALVRNILRIVDHLPFLYILGMILIAISEKKQRVGDMLAKTMVVKT